MQSEFPVWSHYKVYFKTVLAVRSATWLTSTMPWCSWMTVMPQASLEPLGGAQRSTADVQAELTSSTPRSARRWAELQVGGLLLQRLSLAFSNCKKQTFCVTFWPLIMPYMQKKSKPSKMFCATEHKAGLAVCNFEGSVFVGCNIHFRS